MQTAQLTIAFLTALTPTVAVFIATLIQRQDVRDLRSELAQMRTQFQGEMISFRNQVHADMLLIHERVLQN